MSEIEDLLRRHTADVDAALEGFEGQVSSVQDLVTALQSKFDTLAGKIVIPAAARANGPSGGRAAATPFSVASITADDVNNVNRITLSADARKELTSILRGHNTSAMREYSDPDGGILVPEEIRRQIEILVLKQSPMRRLAKIVDFTTSDNVVPISVGGTGAGWVGELEDREETDAPKLAGMRPPGGTVYALPTASEELVDDAIVNLETFLEESVVDAIAEQESKAFISGDGMKKPAGFLGGPAPTAQADDVRPLGTIQYVPSGNASALDPTSLVGVLLSMVFSIKAGYRQAPGCAWVASTAAISKIAGLEDENGRPIYLPSLQAGVPGTLLGFPVEEFEHMDGVAANAFPVAFGNWQRGYLIGDRTQLNILRDPYTTKGVIKWYFRKRVYGSPLNTEAIKVLKIAAA